MALEAVDELVTVCGQRCYADLRAEENAEFSGVGLVKHPDKDGCFTCKYSEKSRACWWFQRGVIVRAHFRNYSWHKAVPTPSDSTEEPATTAQSSTDVAPRGGEKVLAALAPHEREPKVHVEKHVFLT